MNQPEPAVPDGAPPPRPSLDGLHSTVALPAATARPWRQYLAFAGPALLVSVGYMDPGNWSTDLQAGAQSKYLLLWVVGLASLMAMVLQVIAARLGLVTGQDLAQCCREFLPAWTRWPNYLSCELAIAACDLAEVLGSAVAIHLLFPRITLLAAVIITAFDVILLLSFQRLGMRLIEALILVLVATIAGCFFIEIFFLAQTQPNVAELGHSLLAPNLPAFFHRPELLVLAIGIIGATVMPHNLYLHSALVQSRKLAGVTLQRSIRYNTLDTMVALSVAFFVNAAILILAAVVFYGHDHVTLSSGQVLALNNDADWIQVAYATLAPLLGTAAASMLFAVALLASGQSSTITGTLAGQVVMEGFMHWRIAPWVRRLLTRLGAIIPAIILIAMRGEHSINDLMNLSQMILAIQLPLAMFPLMVFASSKRRMGEHRIGWFLLGTGWASCLLITALDLYGLPDVVRQGIMVFSAQ